jgi:hypothetical protein
MHARGWFALESVDLAVSMHTKPTALNRPVIHGPKGTMSRVLARCPAALMPRPRLHPIRLDGVMTHNDIAPIDMQDRANQRHLFEICPSSLRTFAAQRSFKSKAPASGPWPCQLADSSR